MEYLLVMSDHSLAMLDGRMLAGAFIQVWKGILTKPQASLDKLFKGHSVPSPKVAVATKIGNCFGTSESLCSRIGNRIRKVSWAVGSPSGILRSVDMNVSLAQWKIARAKEKEETHRITKPLAAMISSTAP
jgi:hypothetical protein